MKIGDKKLAKFRNLVEQGHYIGITSRDIRNEVGECTDAVLCYLDGIDDGKNYEAAWELLTQIEQQIARNDKMTGEDNFVRDYGRGC